MSSSSPEEEPVRSSVWSFLKMVSSYNSNVLLAALVSLLLVVLFIFLLHFYARFFWSDSDDSRRRRRRRRRRRIIRSVPILSAGDFMNASDLQTNVNATSTDKGLDASAISSIPLFVYEDGEEDEAEEEEGSECAICLGLWEVGDVGRKLRKCGHGFHVECIDMWLSSHSTCPLCRAPVLASTELEDNLKPAHCNSVNGGADEEVRVQVLSEDNGAGDGSRADDEDADPRFSCCLLCRAPVLGTGDDHKLAVDGANEVRLVVFSGGDEDNGGDRRTASSCFGDGSSSSSVVGSSLKRMLSRSRSERNNNSNKVFPSATNDSSEE